MKVEISYFPNVAVMKPSGKITIGLGDVQLREAVRQLLDEGNKNIVANLESVTTIDSSGIGELVSAYTRVTNQGGRFKLCNLPSKISEILHVTQLITVFEVIDSEQEAIDSF